MRWTSIFVSAVFAAVLVGSAATILPRFGAGPVSVILLTVESLRADRFTRRLAPEFFAAAEHASQFRGHRSIASWTGPNIIALLTGLSPFEQGVHARGHAIAAARDVALERLARSGWSVGSIQAFARTENFQNLGMPVAGGESLKGWLARRALSRRPFFFWHHYLETHLPYDPPPAHLSPDLILPEVGDPSFEAVAAVRRLPAVRAGSVAFDPSRDRPVIEGLYDGGIRAFDAWFASFWTFFNASGLRENTVLIVTADHGEELLERGHVGHASTTGEGTLFEESVRVPLFIWWPERAGGLERGARGEPSDHLDIMPTVLDLLGEPYGLGLPGRSLLRPREDYRWHGLTSRAGFAEPNPDDVRNFIAAAAAGRWKLIVESDKRTLVTTRLYDLARDPVESTDVAAARPEVVARLLPPLLDRIRTFALPGAAADTAVRSARTGAAPRWVFPARSRSVSWGDLRGRAYLEWSGEAGKAYIVEYRAGEGPLEVSGRISVDGPQKDFGTFSRNYWETWIVPYKRVTLRVREAPGGIWSETMTITLRK